MRFIFPVIFLWFCSLFLNSEGYCQDINALKMRIKESLDRAINYTADVLIDEKGRSRGNYDTLEESWSSFEPFARTGQLVEGMLAAKDITGNERALTVSKKTGTWMLTLEIKTNPKLKDMILATPGSHEVELISYTTIAEGASGAYELSRVTGDKRYGAIITRACSWMYDNLYNEKQPGTFYNIVNSKSGDVLKVKSKTTSRENQIGMFTTIPRPSLEGSLYKKAFHATNNLNYKTVFLAQADAAISKQSEFGLWLDLEPNNKQSRAIHPYFNTRYALALIDVFEMTLYKNYLEAAYRAGIAMRYLQREDGTIYTENYSDGAYDSTSISGSSVALNGLLWLRLRKHGYNDFNDNIEKSVEWILNHQFPEDHSDQNLEGGYFETITTMSVEGKKQIIVPDLATATGMLFLSEYYKSLP